MVPTDLDPAPGHRRGTALLGIAAVTAVGVLWTALTIPDHEERVWVDTAPAAAAAVATTARLDDGVDWQRVEAAPDAAPMAVAAYEGGAP